MIFSILILDRKLVRYSVTNAIKTLPESHGARDRERTPRKANFSSPIPTTGTGGRTKLTAPFPAAQATSKRSWSITLVHAATKSFANFSFESAHA
jgi:hypothetical protein